MPPKLNFVGDLEHSASIQAYHFPHDFVSLQFNSLEFLEFEISKLSGMIQKIMLVKFLLKHLYQTCFCKEPK
jgi:hypothetical protein